MSTREWRLRIEDILEAIRRIEQYTDGMQYEQWQEDQKTVDAVVRNIEIIGEAAKHVPLEVQMSFPAVPWGKMRGIRNVLIHEYLGVDVEILWQTIREDLPPLTPMLMSLLKQSSE